jgi:hypothetical protein
MNLEIGKNQGSVIIDDNTGQILSVDVYNAVESKFDSIATKSYSRIGDKHYKLEFNNDGKQVVRDR